MLALDGRRMSLLGAKWSQTSTTRRGQTPFSPHLMKILDGQGRGDVIAQGDIHPGQ